MKRFTPPVLLTLLLGATFAQGTSPVDLKLALNVVKSVTENGKVIEKLLPAQGNTPGDVLSQVATVRNVTSRAIKNVQIPLKIPGATFYVAPEKGMDTARTEYSIDGGKTFAPAPLKRKVTLTANGKAVTREVDVMPSEYQSVRYTIPELKAGQTLKLGYRIQIK